MALRMTDYKLLMFTLMVLQPLCSAIQFPDIFVSEETPSGYMERMNSNGFPYVGQTYATYKAKMEELSKTAISEEEFEIFMDSIPRPYEKPNSVNQRNKLTISSNRSTYFGLQTQYTGTQLSQFWTDRLPMLHESYNDYQNRLKDKEDAKIYPHEIFKGFKYFCPNGDAYDIYTKKLKETYGLKGFESQYFYSFMRLFPKFNETSEAYLKRIQDEREAYGDDYWTVMTQNSYDQLRNLRRLPEDTYTTYKTRVEALDIPPMDEEFYNSLKPDV